MKLAQAVGRTQDVKEAEEVTTGWVCVNVGVVPEGSEEDIQAAESIEAQEAVQDPETERDDELEDEEYENPEVDDNYVGFGSQTSSPRIVVQMFTEDKRLEMDLEGLWDFRNTRREKQAENLDTKARNQENVWREKLHEPVLELSGDPLRGAEEENLRLERDGNEGKVEREVDGEWEHGEESGKKTQMEREIDDPKEREGEGEEKPMGGIGAS